MSGVSPLPAGVSLGTDRRLAKWRECRELALLCLHAGESFAAAGEKIGVAAETISAWYREPAFQAQLAEMRRERRERIGRAMDALASEALEGIAAIARDPTCKPDVRLRAWSDLADRCGLARTVEVATTTTRTPEELAAWLAGRLEEARASEAAPAPEHEVIDVGEPELEEAPPPPPAAPTGWGALTK